MYRPEKWIDPVEHIAKALYFDRWLERGFVVASTIYADASGADDTPLCLVAGWYNSVTNWTDDFAPAWRDFLKRWQLPYLHQTQSKNPDADRWKPPKGSPPEAWRTWNQLLVEAASVIERSGASSFVFFTPTADFAAFRADRVADGFADDMDCFSWNAFRFVIHVESWCRERNLKLPEFVFESSNRREEDALAEVMQRYELPKPIFRTKEESDPSRAVVALQAADFLAYEMFKGWKDLHQFGSSTRPHLDRFQRMPNKDWAWTEKKQMDGLMPLSQAQWRLEDIVKKRKEDFGS